MRELPRRRRKVLGVATGERNRVEKELQEANVKLSNALSDIFEVSGQSMLEALLEGKATPEQIARLAKCRAKQKIPEIIESLQGHRLSDHHRMMIRFSLEHLAFLEKQIMQLDEAIAAKIEQLGYTRALDLICSVPGLQATSAANVLAEVGLDMNQFGTPGKLASWAGLCPGNHRTAGKQKASPIPRGNRWLRGALTECAWAASVKKGCFLKEKFWRVATKKQNKAPAAVALAHTVLGSFIPYSRLGTPTRSGASRFWTRDANSASSIIMCGGSASWASVLRRPVYRDHVTLSTAQVRFRRSGRKLFSEEPSEGLKLVFIYIYAAVQALHRG